MKLKKLFGFAAFALLFPETLEKLPLTTVAVNKSVLGWFSSMVLLFKAKLVVAQVEPLPST